MWLGHVFQILYGIMFAILGLHINKTKSVWIIIKHWSILHLQLIGGLQRLRVIILHRYYNWINHCTVIHFNHGPQFESDPVSNSPPSCTKTSKTCGHLTDLQRDNARELYIIIDTVLVSRVKRVDQRLGGECRSSFTGFISISVSSGDRNQLHKRLYTLWI